MGGEDHVSGSVQNRGVNKAGSIFLDPADDSGSSNSSSEPFTDEQVKIMEEESDGTLKRKMNGALMKINRHMRKIMICQSKFTQIDSIRREKKKESTTESVPDQVKVAQEPPNQAGSSSSLAVALPPPPSAPAQKEEEEEIREDGATHERIEGIQCRQS